MYRIFIIIGVLMILFAFSGKAQIDSKYPISGERQAKFFPEINIGDSAHTVTLPNLNSFYWNNWEEIKTLKNEIYLLQAQNNLHEIKKISENYCLNYRSYKKYRKCMLIFNK